MGKSTIVFVGGSFDRQLFDERELFPEPMGRGYTALGPVAQYTYGENTYKFTIVPDKIVLEHIADEFLSDAIIGAADQVGKVLRSRDQGHGVTALGFNTETVFLQRDGGKSGAAFCSNLCNTERIQKAVGSDFQEAQCRIVALRSGVRYTLRIEPHIASNGANLFLSVNGHQDMGLADDLASKLSKAGSARNYIQSVYRNLSHEFRGDAQ